MAYANMAPITRGAMGAALGGIANSATNVEAWASSYRLTRLTAWPSGAGDFGIASPSSAGAELALTKDSEKISTLPSGVTQTQGARVWSFHKHAVLSMWQLTISNTSDVIMQYWGTTGTVIDIEGAFTLVGATVEPYGVAVASATTGQAYYLSPDGNTTHLLTPQGLPTTH